MLERFFRRDAPENDGTQEGQITNEERIRQIKEELKALRSKRLSLDATFKEIRELKGSGRTVSKKIGDIEGRIRDLEEELQSIRPVDEEKKEE